MNQIQLACCSLIASACVLTGLLVVNMEDKQILPSADADLVIASPNLTLMTTRTQANEESLFVLDGQSHKLLIYHLDLARKRVELSASEDLRKLFNLKGGAGGPRRPGR